MNQEEKEIAWERTNDQRRDDKMTDKQEKKMETEKKMGSVTYVKNGVASDRPSNALIDRLVQEAGGATNRQGVIHFLSVSGMANFPGHVAGKMEKCPRCIEDKKTGGEP